TSHLPHLEAGLVVEEKRFRTANYLRTMREGLYMLGASCGIDSPSKFSKRHIAIREANNDVHKLEDYFYLDPAQTQVTQDEPRVKKKENVISYLLNKWQISWSFKCSFI